MIKKIFKKICKPIINMKIFYKLMLFIVCIVLIPLITISITSYKQIQKQVEQQLFESSEQLFNKYIDGIQFKLNIYENLMWGVIFNNSVQEILSEADQWQQQDVSEVHEKISKNIDSMYKSKRVSGIYNIVIYSLVPSFPRDGQNVSNIGAIREESWRDQIDINSRDMNTFYYEVPIINKKVVSIVKPIFDINSDNWDKIGLLKTDILIDSLFELHIKDTNYRNSLCILDENNELIYIEGDLQYEEDDLKVINMLSTEKQSLKYMEVLDNKDVVFYKEINPYGWKVFYITHYFLIHEIMENEKNRVITYCLIVSLLLILITMLFSKMFSRRIQLLNKKMLKVQNGDLEITETIEGMDEIGELDDYFNRSIEKLKSLIRENYIQKLEKREAELVALQLQINPHFLYNTLESINYIAEIYECNEVSIMSQKLGEMFRYSLNKDSEEFVMLYQEENHIKNYIDIHNIRFDNKYNIISDISDEVRKSKVLKFILQPIVENSVTYGFNKKEKGIIQIRAQIIENYLIITVSDDGIGIDNERLEALNVLINDLSFNLKKGHQKSLGLRNVNLRIKMTCGDKYGIKIKSNDGDGTKVIYKLPVYI